jgi:hypothetical protein
VNYPTTAKLMDWASEFNFRIFDVSSIAPVKTGLISSPRSDGWVLRTDL